ncbi:mitochondrial carrier [Imleria badia]|nr:mitochondrial carrier [Imleria badia]
METGHSSTTGNSSSIRAVKDIAFGSIAGVAAEVIEYPFDLAKTWRDEGIRGLYRGIPVPIFGAMAQTAALFVTYSQLQSLIYWSTSSTPPRQLTLAELGLAAAGAGFLTSFIVTPIELVKCKMQVQMLALPPRVPDFKMIPRPFVRATTITNDITRPSALRTLTPRKLPAPLAIIAGIVRTSCLKGLWVGHVGTMIRETGGTAAWFASKELFASLLVARRTHRQPSLFRRFTPHNQSTDLLPWESTLSGALAGGVCVLSLYSADTVKSAIQTSEELRPLDKSTHSARLRNKVGGFWETARAIYKAQGWRGLYAGCGMTVAKAIPCSGIVFVVYDGLIQRYG